MMKRELLVEVNVADDTSIEDAVRLTNAALTNACIAGFHGGAVIWPSKSKTNHRKVFEE
jgi:hypothetical protein